MELLLRLTVFLTIVATAFAWKAAAPEPEPEPLITPGFAAVIILEVCKPIASQRATPPPSRDAPHSPPSAPHAAYSLSFRCSTRSLPSP